MKITGNCLCGSIMYEVTSPIYDARSCHCSRCRKAFSAQASAYALVHAKSFTWIKGEEHLTSFVSEKGEGYQFCEICGTTLCGLVNGEVHGITLGCLNEDPEIKLERHIFVGSKASWEDIGGDVPQYDEFPPE